MFSWLASDSLGVVVDTTFGPMICDPTDGHVSRQLLKWGHYNPEETNLYRDKIAGLNSALIIGAHIGSVALQLADCVDEIVCIEANPSTYLVLKNNVQLQGRADKIRCFNIAASDRPEYVPFLCNFENSGGSKICPEIMDDEFLYDQPKTVAVKGESLDSFFDSLIFDFILMDIEGSEFRAIRGGINLLQRCKVFVVEFVPKHIERVAGVSVDEFASLLLSLAFDRVEFPSLGVSGDPEDLLVKSMRAIKDSGRFEDGVIFYRHCKEKK